MKDDDFFLSGDPGEWYKNSSFQYLEFILFDLTKDQAANHQFLISELTSAVKTL
jgi:hypothetical protein